MDTYLLHLDFIPNGVFLIDLLHDVGLDMLLGVESLSVEFLPILLFAHFHVLLVSQLLLKLLLFLDFHGHDEFLLLSRVVNTLSGLFLIRIELFEAGFHPQHLEFLLFSLHFCLHHREVCSRLRRHASVRGERDVHID